HREEGGEEPQPPPQGPAGPLHHLMPAEPAEAVERTRDATASRALMQLQPAVGAASLLRMVENHRGLVASGTQARRDQRQRRKLHISVITAITRGLRRVC